MPDPVPADPAAPVPVDPIPAPVPNSPWGGPIPLPSWARPGRKPEAVKTPAGVIPGGDATAKNLWIQKILGPIVGTDADGRVWSRNQVTFNFITADPADTLLYPTGHARHPAPRYDWVADGSGNGVEWGYLKDQP